MRAINLVSSQWNNNTSAFWHSCLCFQFLIEIISSWCRYYPPSSFLMAGECECECYRRKVLHTEMHYIRVSNVRTLRNEVENDINTINVSGDGKSGFWTWAQFQGVTVATRLLALCSVCTTHNTNLEKVRQNLSMTKTIVAAAKYESIHSMLSYSFFNFHGMSLNPKC